MPNGFVQLDGSPHVIFVPFYFSPRPTQTFLVLSLHVEATSHNTVAKTVTENCVIFNLEKDKYFGHPSIGKNEKARRVFLSHDNTKVCFFLRQLLFYLRRYFEKAR
jgi:hypothetical protein